MIMFLWPSAAEGLAWLESLERDSSWGNRSGWYVGTDEYERRRAGAEAELAEGLAALRAARGETAGT